MSRKILFGLMMFVLVSSACTLASQSESDDDSNQTVLIVTPTSSALEAESTIPDVVQTEDPVVENDVTDNTENNNIVTCVPRTDWMTYTVLNGDTLSQLATRTGTTVEALVHANCLDNPNLLEVGAQLRVPRFPVNNTPIIPTDVPLVSGVGAYNCSEPNYQPINYVDVVGEGVNYRWGCYDVHVGQTITLSWTDAPQNITQVDFMLRLYETMNPVVIASDTNGADGWRADVVVDASWGQMALFAWTQFGSGIITSDHTGFRVLGAEGSCPPELYERPAETGITLSPIVETLDVGCYGVAGTVDVVVTWDVQSTDLTEATFYRRNALMSRADVFGVDSDPSDGFSAVLRVFPEMEPSIIYISGHGTQQGSEVSTRSIGIYVVP